MSIHKVSERRVLDSSGYESDIENSFPYTTSHALHSTSQPPRSRRRRDRTQFSTSGLATLENSFAADRYPDIHAREGLADELGVTEDRIQVWFQNRRSKLRRRLANRPDPLHLQTNILSTRTPENTPCQSTAMSTPLSSCGPVGLFHGCVPPSYFTTVMQPSQLVAQPKQPDAHDYLSGDPTYSSSKIIHSKPKQHFNRPWETPSPSKTTLPSSNKTFDPVLTTAAVDYSKSLATSGSIMIPSFSPSLSMGHLPVMSPFIPYSALGHPASGYMFFGV